MSPENAGFRHFHDQLQTLKERLLDMSARAEELIDLAVDSLLTRDKEKADAVIAGDREVDMMELECEQLAVSLLALQQPMGRDLRFIISAIKITSDLERVGDHAVNLAQSALRLIALHVEITPTPEIEVSTCAMPRLSSSARCSSIARFQYSTARLASPSGWPYSSKPRLLKTSAVPSRSPQRSKPSRAR